MARFQLLSAEYREAMGKPGSEGGSAEAALSLARLLQNERDGTKESKAAYRRAVELRPYLAGEPYAAFLERTRDMDGAKELASEHIGGLPPNAAYILAKLFRHEMPDRAIEVLRTGTREFFSAEQASLLYSLLYIHGKYQERCDLRDRIRSQSEYLIESVAKLLEKDGWPGAASELCQTTVTVT